jgi:uncharacterized protein
MFETSDLPVDIASAGRPALRVARLGRRGRGVLAAEPIARGTLIERAPVIVIPEADRANVDGSPVGNHIFMWEHGTTGDDIYSGKGQAAVVLGLASLINHSSEPNCRFIRHIEALALDLLALRDIAAGEELTFDYGMALWFEPD